MKTILITGAAGFVGRHLTRRRLDDGCEVHAVDNIRPPTVLPVVFDEDRRRGFELLAEAYRLTRIFVNLPSYSRLLVTKVTEVMAWRTILITLARDHPTDLGNMDQFKDGQLLIYYDPGRPEALGGVIEHYLARPDATAAIADASWREIHRGHTLRYRLRKILADALAIG